MDNIGYFIALYSFLPFAGDCCYSSLLFFFGFISPFSASYFFIVCFIAYITSCVVLLSFSFAINLIFFIISLSACISIAGFLLGIYGFSP